MIGIKLTAEQLILCQNEYFNWLLDLFSNKGDTKKMQFLISSFKLPIEPSVKLSNGAESVEYLQKYKKQILNHSFNIKYDETQFIGTGSSSPQFNGPKLYNSQTALKRLVIKSTSKSLYSKIRGSDLIYKIYKEILGLTSCPYCNKNTLEYYEKDNKKYCRFEVDHQKPISKYPEYGIHFFNLIPSCKNCNFIKLDGSYPSPYKLQNDNSKFKIDLSSASYEDIIRLDKIPVAFSMGNYDDLLAITERYNSESSKVRLIIRKKHWYDDNYKKLLNNTLNRVMHNEIDVKEILEVNYNEDDYFSTPYSKLTNDLIKELDELKRGN